MIPHAWATSFTKLSEPWMFKLSTTNSHDASGSKATVCSMWLAKSASVRVGPIVGAINSPVVTWKFPIRHTVPCRVYSNSICAGFPAIIGRVEAIAVQRLQAGHLVHADGVRLLGPFQLGCRAVRVTDGRDLLGELLRVLLGGVQPIPTLVGLQGGLPEVAAHLRRRDRGDDAALGDLVGQFVSRPMGDGPAGVLGGLAGDGQDLGDLLGGEFAGGSGSRLVGEDLLDGASPRSAGLEALDADEAVEGRGPAASPAADLVTHRPTASARSSLRRPSKASKMRAARWRSREAVVTELQSVWRMSRCRSVMVILAALPGMRVVLLVTGNLVNPGNFRVAVNFLESQLRIVGLATIPFNES